MKTQVLHVKLVSQQSKATNSGGLPASVHPTLKVIDKSHGGSQIPVVHITPGPSRLLDRPNGCSVVNTAHVHPIPHCASLTFHEVRVHRPPRIESLLLNVRPPLPSQVARDIVRIDPRPQLRDVHGERE